MSNEDLYGPGFSEEESDESVFELQRLILERDEAMEYAQKCERNAELFHYQMSRLNRQYELQCEHAQKLEAQSQMQDELIIQQAKELKAQAAEIIKLKEDVAKFKVKMLPLCPSPGGKIRRKSPSPSPRSPDSSDSCPLKLRGTPMKEKPLPPTPPKLNKGIHLNHLDQL
jgi:hypothetical protein